MTTTTESPENDAASRLLSAAMAARPVAVALGTLSAILFAALFSHSPRDGSFWNATSDATANWLGGFGANVSCALFFAMGNAAFLIPLALAVWSWRLWGGRFERRVIAPVRIGVPAVGALLAAAAFFSAVPGK